MINPSETVQRKTEIGNRRQQVAALYLRGVSQADIGDQLGVDQSTISRDLTELRKEWLERSINHIDQKKAIELAKLDRLEVTYWEAWERSLKNAETEIVRETPLGHSIRETKSVGQSGNPAFLEGVLKCIAQRCAILGIEAAKKMDVTTRGEAIKAFIGVNPDDWDNDAAK
jgi:hypothetical protein